MRREKRRSTRERNFQINIFCLSEKKKIYFFYFFFKAFFSLRLEIGGSGRCQCRDLQIKVERGDRHPLWFRWFLCFSFRRPPLLKAVWMWVSSGFGKKVTECWWVMDTCSQVTFIGMNISVWIGSNSKWFWTVLLSSKRFRFSPVLNGFIQFQTVLIPTSFERFDSNQFWTVLFSF